MMTSQLTPRQHALRQWMRDRDITWAALAAALGLSLSRTKEIVREDYVSTNVHARLWALGLPADLLPEARDRKRGPKPKIPRFPERRDATLAQASEKSPANGEGSFA